MFWGVLFIAIGILMIIKHVFGLELPVFKILLGLFFVYIGIKVIFGSFHMQIDSVKNENMAIFSESEFRYPSTEKSKEYQAVFGRGRMDLTQVDLSQGNVELSVGTVFGDLTVLVDPKTPLVVKVNSAFGSVELPSKDKVSFGEYTYQSDAARNFSGNKLILETNTVFGSLKIKNP